ncbi:hypothetical protein FB451DRAFT_1461172 [Mycena latifolia]|nr:hypothetical protein FB451DRAFT_1461172 [Mycena latifolia]
MILKESCDSFRAPPCLPHKFRGHTTYREFHFLADPPRKVRPLLYEPRAAARSSSLPPSATRAHSLLALLSTPSTLCSITIPPSLSAAATTTRKIIRLLSLNLPHRPSLRSPSPALMISCRIISRPFSYRPPTHSKALLSPNAPRSSTPPRLDNLSRHSARPTRHSTPAPGLCYDPRYRRPHTSPRHTPFKLLFLPHLTILALVCLRFPLDSVLDSDAALCSARGLPPPEKTQYIKLPEEPYDSLRAPPCLPDKFRRYTTYCEFYSRADPPRKVRIILLFSLNLPHRPSRPSPPLSARSKSPALPALRPHHAIASLSRADLREAGTMIVPFPLLPSPAVALLSPSARRLPRASKPLSTTVASLRPLLPSARLVRKIWRTSSLWSPTTATALTSSASPGAINLTNVLLYPRLEIFALVLQCRGLPFDSVLDSDAALHSARGVCSGRGPLTRFTSNDSPFRRQYYGFAISILIPIHALHCSTSAVSPLLPSACLVRKMRCTSSLWSTTRATTITTSTTNSASLGAINLQNILLYPSAHAPADSAPALLEMSLQDACMLWEHRDASFGGLQVFKVDTLGIRIVYSQPVDYPRNTAARKAPFAHFGSGSLSHIDLHTLVGCAQVDTHLYLNPHFGGLAYVVQFIFVAPRTRVSGQNL